MKKPAMVFLIALLASQAHASTDGPALTKSFEGFSSTPYLDSRGVETIGYGFNCQFIDCSHEMTRAEADVIFAIKYIEAHNRAKRFSAPVWDALTDAQKVVLTDMAYNLGNRLFGFIKMRAAVHRGDWGAVAHEMHDSEWFKQVGRRGPALVKLIEERLRDEIQR